MLASASRPLAARGGVPWCAGVVLCALAAALPANAETYVLPPSDQAVVGTLRTVRARARDTLLDIARAHNLGYEEIRLANPDVDPWLPGEATQVVIPSRFLLPDAPRTGIVVNVAEMRLYYYPPVVGDEMPRVVTFPVSVGRGDWETPLASARVQSKERDPAWIPPESIRAEHAARGDFLPARVPPGPDNPLGRYALRLSLPGYLIHGTNRPSGVGMRVTHGCLRLYPENIEALYENVPVGTPVHIVNQPYKIGWHLDELMLEAHPPLSETNGDTPADMTSAVRAFISATSSGPPAAIDWDRVYAIARERSGVPEPVGAAARP